MSGGVFVHTVAAAVVKWVARVRAGCLASRLRLFNHHLQASSVCPCCGAEEEDDAHIVCGCPGTGSVNWLAMFKEVWALVSGELSVSLDPPPDPWLDQFRIPLLAALLPAELATYAPQSIAVQVPFLRKLHRRLAGDLAERLRRREVLIALSAPVAPPAAPGPALPPTASLPPERLLTTQELCRLESERRSTQATPSPSVVTVSSPVIPPSGEARRRWLRRRLEVLLREDTMPCCKEAAVPTMTLLALFETVTGELFSDTPGVKLVNRIRGLGRVMANVLREVSFEPPLCQFQQHEKTKSFWTRRPRALLDVAAWELQMRAAEAQALPVLSLKRQMQATDAGLASWLKSHRYLRAVEVGHGESGMALLLLWEVDHEQSFPKHGGDEPSAVLLGFTRRLKKRVEEDVELRSWLVCKETQRALQGGVPAVHHFRWSVKVIAPPPDEPQGWYEEFSRRWRAYLASLVLSAGADQASSSVAVAEGTRTMAVARAPGAARRRRQPLRPSPLAKPASTQVSATPAAQSLIADGQSGSMGETGLSQQDSDLHGVAASAGDSLRVTHGSSAFETAMEPPSDPGSSIAQNEGMIMVNNLEEMLLDEGPTEGTLGHPSGRGGTGGDTTPHPPALPGAEGIATGGTRDENVTILQSSSTMRSTINRRQPRRESQTEMPPGKRRQGDLRAWLRPIHPTAAPPLASPVEHPAAPMARHGRAAAGAPT